MKRLLALVLLIVAVVADAAGLRRYPYVGAVSADATGRVLVSDGADRPAYIASVSKLMTALLVIEDVRARRYSFSDRVKATPDVYFSESSWIGLKTGDEVSVRDLMVALMVESANDAAIALGVHSAGSLSAFVAKMNSRAAELGMSATAYYSPNGLPPNAGRRYPWKKFNVSTAADQLKLAVKLVSIPETLEFTRIKDCDLVKTPYGYRVSVCGAVGRPRAATVLAAGEKTVKHFANHNNVMVKNALKVVNSDGTEAVDGLKTGYIDAGGSSVVMTGIRNGKRVIVVVLGSDSGVSEFGKTKGMVVKSSIVRDENARRLLIDALGAVDF